MLFQGLKEVSINIWDIPSYEHARNYLCSGYVLRNILLTKGDGFYQPILGSDVTHDPGSHWKSVDNEEVLDMEGKDFTPR